MRLALAALLLLALPASAQTAPQWASEVTALTNAERAKVGCPALTLDARLSKAAQAHTDEMSRNSALAHEGANGSTPGDRATAAGYTWTAVAENIAAGQPTPTEVVGSWMKSPGHRQNILNCVYRHIGVGYVRRTGDRFGHYWTQVFGEER
jgi:uncharacterized protein YkwD